MGGDLIRMTMQQYILSGFMQDSVFDQYASILANWYFKRWILYIFSVISVALMKYQIRYVSAYSKARHSYWALYYVIGL